MKKRLSPAGFLRNKPQAFVFITFGCLALLMSACSTLHQSRGSSAGTHSDGTQSGKIGQVSLKKDVFYFNPLNKQNYVNSEAKFSLRPIDKGKYLDHIEVSIDNNKFVRYQDQIQFLTEGPHILRFRSVDPVLNWSPIQTMRIYVDLTPPEIKPYWEGLTETIDNKLYVRTDSFLRFEAQDNLSGVAKIMIKKSLNDPIQPASDKISFTEPGHHTIYACAVDNVGNASEWLTIDFTVDADKPETSYKVIGQNKSVANQIYLNNDARVELKAKDASSGVKQIEYRLNDGPELVYKHPVSISSKVVSLRYRATDNLDNKEEWKSAKFIRDSQSPSIKIVESGRTVKDRGIIYAKPGYTLSLNVNDEESGVQKILVSKDGNGFQETKQTSFTFNEPGIQHFIVRATDFVGNIEESEVYSIFIDNDVDPSKLKPKKELIKHDNVYLSALPNNIDIAASDSGVGIDYVEYSYDGQNFQRLVGQIDLASWKNEQQTLYYHAVDKLGNVEKTQQITIKIQTASPVVDLYIDTSAKPDTRVTDIIKSHDQDPHSAPTTELAH